MAAVLTMPAEGKIVTIDDERETVFHTTAGPLRKSEIGFVLAHQHLFAELGPSAPVAYLEADPARVEEVIGPWLVDAKALGIGVILELTPEGIGRRPDIVKHVADRAGLPVMLVTGLYREPYLPAWVLPASVAEVAGFLRDELTGGVADTGVPAGFIKLSQNATGITLTERKILEAACIAARETNAAIASHVTSGPTALSVMDALEGFGCPLDRYRFVWVHAQVTAVADGAALEGDRTGTDPGFGYLLTALERGAYVSLDAIGNRNAPLDQGGFDVNIAWIERLVEAGYGDRIIIGSDTGWYDPSFRAGFEVEQVGGRWTMVGAQAQDYRSIPADFVPAMEAAGLPSTLVRRVMHDNPWLAFSR